MSKAGRLLLGPGFPAMTLVLLILGVSRETLLRTKSLGLGYPEKRFCELNLRAWAPPDLHLLPTGRPRGAPRLSFSGPKGAGSDLGRTKSLGLGCSPCPERRFCELNPWV